MKVDCPDKYVCDEETSTIQSRKMGKKDECLLEYILSFMRKIKRLKNIKKEAAHGEGCINLGKLSKLYYNISSAVKGREGT